MPNLDNGLEVTFVQLNRLKSYGSSKAAQKLGSINVCWEATSLRRGMIEGRSLKIVLFLSSLMFGMLNRVV